MTVVRESFRTSQGPRSRTVCNISALPAEVRDLVAAALSGQSCVVLERIELSQVRQRRLLQAMIFGRILFPCAKLALIEQASVNLPRFGPATTASAGSRSGIHNRLNIRAVGGARWQAGLRTISKFLAHVFAGVSRSLIRKLAKPHV
jgi:hypothetical protein